MTQSTAETLVPFDYTALPDGGAGASDAAERIRVGLASAAKNIVEIGHELIEQKAALGHGRFLAWVAAEFEMSDRTARNFMRVAERFGSNRKALSNLPPTALYMLAAPSTPQVVTDQVLARADAGEAPSVREIDRLKRAAKQDIEEQKAPAPAGKGATKETAPAGAPRRSPWRHWLPLNEALEHLIGLPAPGDVNIPPSKRDDLARRVKLASAWLEAFEQGWSAK